MNFNLKNRPRFGKAIRRESAIAFNQQYEKWFEEFEKELRELMKLYPPKNACTRQINHLFKQILGEK